MSLKARASTVAGNLLARPGAAPARSPAVEDLPRPSVPTPEPDQPGGIKEKTIGTTLYLLPSEHRRIKRLALDMDVVVHELILQGLDRMLAEHGQQVIKRYSAPRPRKG